MISLGDNMKKININGQTFSDTNSFKIYNLTNKLLYCLDIFISSESNESVTWLLTPNEDDTAKFSLKFDDDNNRLFEFRRENAGESFTHPIIYKRDNNSNQTTIMLPANNEAYQQEIYMIAGSNQSNRGINWSRFNEEDIDEDTIASAHGLNISADNMLKDDFVLIEIVPSNTTNLDLLDIHLANIIFCAHESTHIMLKKDYLYYNDENEYPTDIEIGIQYR